MIDLRQFQRMAYLASRTTGDVRAAQRGPEVLAKRLIRRRATRSLFSAFRNFR